MKRKNRTSRTQRIIPDHWEKTRVSGKIISNFLINRTGSYADRPYSERKAYWLDLIAKRGGKLAVNRKWCYKTHTNEPESKDLRRMIKEGILVMHREKDRKNHGTSYITVA